MRSANWPSCCLTECISSHSTLIFTVRVRNGVSLANTFSNAQTCLQNSSVFQSIWHPCLELRVKNFQLPKFAFMMRKVSLLMRWIRAFLQMLLHFCNASIRNSKSSWPSMTCRAPRKRPCTFMRLKLLPKALTACTGWIMWALCTDAKNKF